jgi:hypothetical protein
VRSGQILWPKRQYHPCHIIMYRLTFILIKKIYNHSFSKFKTAKHMQMCLTCSFITINEIFISTYLYKINITTIYMRVFMSFNKYTSLSFLSLIPNNKKIISLSTHILSFNILSFYFFSFIFFCNLNTPFMYTRSFPTWLDDY